MNARNMISVINSRVVAVIRCGAVIRKVREEELQGINRKSRRHLTIDGGYHPHVDMDRLYMRRTNGAKRLISV